MALARISLSRDRELVVSAYMFTNSQRQEERTGKYGTPRVQYLQELVTRFQNASSEETKEKIVANLANFAYDPFNFTFLRQVKNLRMSSLSFVIQSSFSLMVASICLVILNSLML